MREFIIITLKVPTFILDFHLFLLEFGWLKRTHTVLPKATTLNNAVEINPGTIFFTYKCITSAIFKHFSKISLKKNLKFSQNLNLFVVTRNTNVLLTQSACAEPVQNA